MYRFGFTRVSILQSGRSRLSNRHPNASPRPDAREDAAAKSGSQSEFRPSLHRICQKVRPMPAYAGASGANVGTRTSQGAVCSGAPTTNGTIGPRCSGSATATAPRSCAHRAWRSRCRGPAPRKRTTAAPSASRARRSRASSTGRRSCPPPR